MLHSIVAIISGSLSPICHKKIVSRDSCVQSIKMLDEIETSTQLRNMNSLCSCKLVLECNDIPRCWKMDC